MDKEKEIRDYNHVLNLIDRKNVSISGVKKVDSFDAEEFLIESVMGYIVLKGEGLEMLKLDTREGVVTIKGYVNSINYVDDKTNKKDKDNSIISRLFKWI